MANLAIIDNFNLCKNSYYYALGNQIDEVVSNKFERVKKNKHKIFIPKTEEKLPKPSLTETMSPGFPKPSTTWVRISFIFINPYLVVEV